MIYKRCFIFLLSLFFSCGDFLGFSSFPEPKYGSIDKVKLSLNNSNLTELYESVFENNYAPCIFQSGNVRADALIKVRGLTSRFDRLKSFTIKIKKNDTKYTFEAGATLTNQLAMYTYSKIGLPAPETKAINLFINDEYLGCFNRIAMYREKSINSHYGTPSGEMYKAFFKKMGYDIPVQGMSEKKFPGDENFRTFNLLLEKALNLSSSEWINWTARYVDKDEIAKYMAVHDFLSVRDTSLTNFYIYSYGKYIILPWDNEISMNLDKPCELKGHNMITRRLMEDPEIKQKYDSLMEKYFLPPVGPDDLINDLKTETLRIFNEADTAVSSNYKYFVDYSAEYNMMIDFLNNRAAQIP